MGKKCINLALCIVFCLGITIPLLFADWVGGETSATENRVKQLFPTDLTAADFMEGTVQTELENWIADNACGRDAASKFSTLAHYYLWHMSARSDTLIGRDDWFFLYNQAILWDYQNVHILSDEAIDSMVGKIEQLKAALDEQGIPLLVVGVPDKKTVYSDYFPDTVLKYEFLQPMADTIAEKLAATDVPCLWLKNALLEARQEHQVYYARYDTAHWNMWGAFTGYSRIAERLTEMGINVRVLRETDFRITEETMTSLFNGALPVSETDAIFTFLQQPDITQDPEWFSQFSEMHFSDAPDTYRRRLLNADSSLPKMVFIGDSYSIAMEEFFAASVSEYTFVHINDLSSVMEVIRQAKPDVVVLEYVERITRTLDDNLNMLYP